MQKYVDEFRDGEWFKRFHEGKNEFMNKLRLIPSYNNIDWKTQDSNTIMEFCIKWPSIGAITVLEAFAILYCGEHFKCKTFVEIGRFCGRSTLLFAVMAKRAEGITLSIDPRSSISLLKTFKDLNLSDYVIFEDKWSPWINLPLPIDEIDFLFIDGDHSFMSVIVDYHLILFPEL